MAGSVTRSLVTTRPCATIVLYYVVLILSLSLSLREGAGRRRLCFFLQKNYIDLRCTLIIPRRTPFNEWITESKSRHFQCFRGANE